jgi:hypothetical protein
LFRIILVVAVVVDKSSTIKTAPTAAVKKMSSTGHDDSVATITLAPRSSLVENATTSQSLHDASYCDGGITSVTSKPSKTSNISVSLHRRVSANPVTAASTQLGAKIAGDGKH